MGPKEVVPPVAVERVQLGVRTEKKMVKVLRGLAEYRNLTLGQLLEKIVIYGMDFDTHASRRFQETEADRPSAS